jgi:ring-1,2-phenylacetyl-CoA epoxidase subunit PaaC
MNFKLFCPEQAFNKMKKMNTNLLTYTLRIADDSLILGQRLSEWCGHGPILEEDIALTNIALDLVGQATTLLNYAAELEGKGRDGDDLAFLRYERDFKNCLLVEQQNVDFGVTIARQFFFDVFRKLFFEKLCGSTNEMLAAVAEKSLKETKYHVKHSSEWMIRLGDGTEESHARIQEAVDSLWRYTDELFYMDEVDAELLKEGVAVDLSALKLEWTNHVEKIFEEATLTIPSSKWMQQGGRQGLHSEHLGYLLAEMQYMQRAYPGMKW